MNAIFYGEEAGDCFVLQNKQYLRTSLASNRNFNNESYKDFAWSFGGYLKKEKPILFSLLKDKGKQIETSV